MKYGALLTLLLFAGPVQAQVKVFIDQIQAIKRREGRQPESARAWSFTDVFYGALTGVSY
jgi:hypothetical protein